MDLFYGGNKLLGLQMEHYFKTEYEANFAVYVFLMGLYRHFRLCLHVIIK